MNLIRHVIPEIGSFSIGIASAVQGRRAAVPEAAAGGKGRGRRSRDRRPPSNQGCQKTREETWQWHIWQDCSANFFYFYLSSRKAFTHSRGGDLYLLLNCILWRRINQIPGQRIPRDCFFCQPPPPGRCQRKSRGNFPGFPPIRNGSYPQERGFPACHNFCQSIRRITGLIRKLLRQKNDFFRWKSKALPSRASRFRTEIRPQDDF